MKRAVVVLVVLVGGLVLPGCKAHPVDHSTALVSFATTAQSDRDEQMALRDQRIAQAQALAQARADAEAAAARQAVAAKAVAKPSRSTRLAPVPPLSFIPDAAFWRRLANCESRYGASGAYVGFFQLTWGNAARVGIGPSSSYDEQVAGAQRWLAIIGGRGGTTAGWPVCWWTALRG